MERNGHPGGEWSVAYRMLEMIRVYDVQFSLVKGYAQKGKRA